VVADPSMAYRDITKAPVILLLESTGSMKISAVKWAEHWFQGSFVLPLSRKIYI
jgi:hypothetical protein